MSITVLSDEERQNTVLMAKLAEQSERYDDMVLNMQKIARTGSLQMDERNLLSVAYKNVVGARRASWRVLNQAEGLVKDKMESEVLQRYLKKVERELQNLCNDVLSLLREILIPQCPDENYEERVFYLKMAGDYFRYLAEFLPKGTEPSTQAQNSAKSMYEEAVTIGREHLESTNPILLGLTLNYSVFYFEICNEPDGAIALAKEGFDRAVENLDNLPEESYKDATLIMQLLRDNLTLWNSRDRDEDPAGQ